MTVDKKLIAAGAIATTDALRAADLAIIRGAIDNASRCAVDAPTYNVIENAILSVIFTTNSPVISAVRNAVFYATHTEVVQ